MALKFLSNHASSSSTSSSVKFCEIRLDNDYIVFRGGEDEAASAQLAGSLVLCLTDSMSINHVNLTLNGIVRMSYMSASTSAMSGRRFAAKEKVFFEKTWTFRDPGKGRSETLMPENYEWPFSEVLDGSMPESVEGLRDAYVIYRLKAEISRKRGKDIVVRKPLRIVRTIGATALELSHAMSVENVWPNKVEYSISTPSKAVVFGSFLKVDFKLIPLLKGLVIGNIATQLKEEQEFVVDPEWAVPAVNGGLSREDRIIAYDNYTINPEEDEQIIDEAAEGFQFSRYLELPKTLNQCLQDCNVKGIKVRHKIKFNIQLHNPDGHVSELRANLPVTLYISPSLPIDEENNLVDQSPQAGRAAVLNHLEHSAPPLYGEHMLDQLYSDVDHSGYRTPGIGMSTPATPFITSRRGSSDNIMAIDSLANDSGSISASALQHRLQDLRLSERSTAPVSRSLPHDENEQPRSGILSRRSSQPHIDAQRTSGDGISHSNPIDIDHSRLSPSNFTNGLSSQPESDPISRQNSGEENPPLSSGIRTPFSFTDHYEDLAKVPSYTTAVRTRTPLSPDVSLPTYGAAVQVRSSPSPPMEPPQAFIRPGGRQVSSEGDYFRGASVRLSSTTQVRGR